MKILVTGSKGYIGRFIEMELALRYGNANVTGFDEGSDRAEWECRWGAGVL